MFPWCLAVSVPVSERHLANSWLPGAVIAEGGMDDVAQTGGVRLLSVMIHDAVDEERLAAFPALEAVVTRSDGTDHLPLAWCRNNGVACYHLADYATTSVAQMAVAFTIAVARRFPKAFHGTHGAAPRWDRRELVGRHLDEMTIGIVGTGRIGTEVVRILDAMGARMVAYDIAPEPGLQARHRVTYVDTLYELLATSDIVSLHVPLDDSTRHIIDAAAIAAMRPGAALVNTCRGGVVDADAVASALEGGHMSGFAADTLEGEPVPPALARLAALKNVLLTPHLGAHNGATMERRYQTLARIVTAHEAGDHQALAPYRVA